MVGSALWAVFGVGPWYQRGDALLLEKEGGALSVGRRRYVAGPLPSSDLAPTTLGNAVGRRHRGTTPISGRGNPPPPPITIPGIRACRPRVDRE